MQLMRYNFFAHRHELEREIAKTLNVAHRNQAQRFNERYKAKEIFALGDLVWFLRPRTHATNKLLSWWIGPCPVLDRLGENSYLIEVKPGVKMTVHRQQLKICLHDKSVWQPPLHQFLLSTTDEQEVIGEVDQPAQASGGAAATSSSSSSSRVRRSAAEENPVADYFENRCSLGTIDHFEGFENLKVESKVSKDTDSQKIALGCDNIIEGEGTCLGCCEQPENRCGSVNIESAVARTAVDVERIQSVHPDSRPQSELIHHHHLPAQPLHLPSDRERLLSNLRLWVEKLVGSSTQEPSSDRSQGNQ